MTKTISIDGQTVNMDDGRSVCIGYYEDTGGRVIARFAVPPGGREVPDVVSTIEYVDSLNELPPVDDEYRTPP